MNAQKMTEYNLGENLDKLMNLDPRGYGVCNILYAGAREFTGEPLTMHCAKGLQGAVKPGDIVYIITGFVLMPNKHAEMDGIVSAMLLARALVKAYDVKPLIIAPEECNEAVKNLAPIIGLHLYTDMDAFKEYPISVGNVVFTKDADKAEALADSLMAELPPKAVIAVEAPGANEKGVYHNAIGKNFTHLEAKADILLKKCKEAGIWNMAIGDLGNELGKGALKYHIEKYVPYMGKGGCICGCEGGSMSAVAADNVITATISDWGCYGLIAATAYLNRDIEIMHTGDMEKDAIRVASNSGMVDMYGWLEYAIDGVEEDFHVDMVNIMRRCVAGTFKNEKRCSLWFEKVDEKHFFEK